MAEPKKNTNPASQPAKPATSPVTRVGLALILRDVRGSKGRQAAGPTSKQDDNYQRSANGWEVLVTRRPTDTVLAGCLEFPGGKVEPDETVAAAVAREVQEELGIAVLPRAELAVVEHAYDHATVRLHAWWCSLDSSPPAAAHPGEPRWMRLDALPLDEFPEANRALVRRVLEAVPRVVGQP